MKSRKATSHNKLAPSDMVPPAAPTNDKKKHVKMAVNKTEVSTEVSKDHPVTSQPTAAAAAAAGGDARASTMMQMMKTVRESRQQVSELRQKAEKAFDYMQKVNSERRQQFVEIQLAKAQLNVIHSQLANIINLNIDKNAIVSPEQLPPKQSDKTPT